MEFFKKLHSNIECGIDFVLFIGLVILMSSIWAVGIVVRTAWFIGTKPFRWRGAA